MKTINTVCFRSHNAPSLHPFIHTRHSYLAPVVQIYIHTEIDFYPFSPLLIEYWGRDFVLSVQSFGCHDEKSNQNHIQMPHNKRRI